MVLTVKPDESNGRPVLPDKDKLMQTLTSEAFPLEEDGENLKIWFNKGEGRTVIQIAAKCGFVEK